MEHGFGIDLRGVQVHPARQRRAAAARLTRACVHGRHAVVCGAEQYALVPKQAEAADPRTSPRRAWPHRPAGFFDSSLHVAAWATRKGIPRMGAVHLHAGLRAAPEPDAPDLGVCAQHLGNYRSGRFRIHPPPLSVGVDVPDLGAGVDQRHPLTQGGRSVREDHTHDLERMSVSRLTRLHERADRDDVPSAMCSSASKYPVSSSARSSGK